MKELKIKRVNDILPEDIIGRNFSEPNLDILKEQLQEQVVLVTGAGGSIGSEICRQLLQMKIKRLILAEHSEINLYKILEEIKEMNIDQSIEVIPSLINICNSVALEYVFNEYRPTFVYHAAAYKHVNIVQTNPFSGIQNNILSTKNIVEISAKYKVKKFVLISTDKAVRPTNTMGATKRICELITSQTALNTGLDFSSVRFGNVAGSSGSLIPKLQSQISKGKPLTITDPRMTRYFMLIPEAVSLVLKASEESKPADIKLLNMGKPIKIIDIAKRILTLSGRDPKDYPIHFIGPGPGEKLYEELFVNIKDEDLAKETVFFTAKGGESSFESFDYNNETYNSIFEVVEKIIDLSLNFNKNAIDLVWKTIENEFFDSNVINVDFNKSNKKSDQAA
ncbi:MAG: polysaccharide biosynthesis protein [Bacteriovoracaceae bacterium]|jgi:FlaA1/EpsC-like NDP-sugar epimerase|nr:polysaccharide biosynthesis protein [Bacteriovoracaceae bacterium]